MLGSGKKGVGWGWGVITVTAEASGSQTSDDVHETPCKEGVLLEYLCSWKSLATCFMEKGTHGTYVHIMIPVIRLELYVT